MNKKYYSLIVLLICILSSCTTAPPLVVNNNLTLTKYKKPLVNHPSKIIIIDHKYFKIAYNPSKRLAQYVSYQLTASQLRIKSAKRSNKFISDPFLIENNIPHVVTTEYAKSGYDRGHLAPSADFAWDQDANNMTFLMSNMVPQLPGLNRDAWKKLEDQVRKWVCGEEKVTIITGPIFSSNLPALESGLEIPQRFFKVVIDETAPKKMIAFIYHQQDKGNVLLERVVPMTKVERATGIAFNIDFPDLDNENIRSPASLNDWREADCR